jgi:hypothetical protein
MVHNLLKFTYFLWLYSNAVLSTWHARAGAAADPAAAVAFAGGAPNCARADFVSMECAAWGIAT